MNFLLNPDGRRAAAFLAILGGCIIMTGFAGVGLWLVRNSPGHVFWLACIAHGHIFLGMWVYGAMFIRRILKASRNGFELSDQEAGK